jgi:energy-coupling factor transporter ATP-binding protein EcfA2
MVLPDLHGSLWAWVQSLPPWQSDLLRRLALLDVVRDEDLAEASGMVLGAFNAAVDGSNVAAPVPIPALGANTASTVVKLLALRDLVAVGSTPSGQHLRFAPTGMTVVYGENGSGKSSYARVLRKACRACAKPVEILPNVLKSGAGLNQSRAGTAQIDILTGTVASVIQRDVNALPEPALAQVSFFDADCASVYSDEESEVTYIPSSLRLFERLVSLQTQIKKKVDEEIARLDTLQVATNGFAANTRAGALVAQLSENVNPDTVTKLSTVSAEERARLDKLRADVKTATENDPLKVSGALERKAVAAERLVTLLDTLRRGVDQSVVSELLALSVAAEKLAGQSAKLSDALSKASVREVGSDGWKSFWHAAHGYLADLDEAFPPAVDAHGVHCPLCQQELSSEAVTRLHRFEEFFLGDVENQSREVGKKRAAIVAALAKLPSVEEQLATQTPLVFGGEATPSEEAVAANVAAFVKSVAQRREAIQRSAMTAEIQAPSLEPDPTDSIRQWIQNLRQKAAEQKALAAPDAVAKAKAEVSEFEDRLLLSERLPTVLLRIETLKRIGRLRKASTALSTTGLSRKIGEFTESAVTAQLRSRLVTELGDASLEHLPVNMGARAPKGKTRVSIGLDTTRQVEVKEVLSEGERRAVAIAFFLAEVAVLEHDGGIVLDDPVSSLDHARRSYVARRLVEEAARRQVIVFTHDVVFLLELQEFAEGVPVPHEMRVVRRVGTDAGVASNDLPWIALNVGKRIGHLKNELQQLAALERKGDPDKYRQQVKTWFELLREAWERAVEEKLFNGVVGRFQPGIKTMSLSSVSVTPALTAAVEKGMTDASKWTHDMAPALNRPAPKATELQASLSGLESFVAQFKK